MQERPALDGGVLRDTQPELPQRKGSVPEIERQARTHRRCPASSRCRKRRSSNSLHIIAKRFSKRCICASDIVDKRLSLPQSRDAILEAWKALNAHSKKNENLGFLLREFQNEQDRILSEVYSRLRSENGGDDQKQTLLDGVDGRVRNDLTLYMLFPETGLITYLIEELEAAAQPDDGLVHGEQDLKDQLKYVREALGRLDSR